MINDAPAEEIAAEHRPIHQGFPDVPGHEDDAPMPEAMEQALRDGAPFATFVWKLDESGSGGFSIHSNIPRNALGIGLAHYLISILQETAADEFDRTMALNVIRPFATLADRIGPLELVQHPSAPIPGHYFHNAKQFMQAVQGAVPHIVPEEG